MLRLLRIRNLALIRELEIEFDTGLNLLTGETGSGKSILVDALGLLLGSRSSQEMIRTDCDSAVLEGIFDIQPGGPIRGMLAESGFECEDDELLVRREISVSGRNRVFINNHLGTVSLLKSLGEKLVDIHGQQDQRSLLDLSTHLEWLDSFGGNAALLKEVNARFRRLRETARRLSSLQTDEQERLRRIDILKFQIDEIRAVNPKQGEKEALEAEENLLSNRERILATAGETYAMIYESETSLLRGLAYLERRLDDLANFDRSWLAHRDSLQECRYKLEDTAYAARDYLAGSDFSPERLEQVQQRLYAIEKLTKKYGASSSDILDYLQRCENELDELLSYSESSERLKDEMRENTGAYLELATALSEKRRRDARRLEKEIRREFAALAMERMEMQVYFRPQEQEDDAATGRMPGFYGLNGIDHVEFLIAPNKGEEIRPLAKIASGGELSRLMLAIKCLCGGEESGRTLVFDEVDSGIGGRVAEAVGKRLRDIAGENQVLCVTHLPQIAAFARQHYSVRKKVAGGRTETVIQCLNEQERVQELSRMLGGETITETTRKHAKEMLEHSRELRNKESRSNIWT